jgi:hypothetical protein
MQIRRDCTPLSQELVTTPHTTLSVTLSTSSYLNLALNFSPLSLPSSLSLSLFLSFDSQVCATTSRSISIVAWHLRSLSLSLFLYLTHNITFILCIFAPSKRSLRLSSISHRLPLFLLRCPYLSRKTISNSLSLVSPSVLLSLTPSLLPSSLSLMAISIYQ